MAAAEPIHLVDEDQPFRLDMLSDHHSPGTSQELVSFQCLHCSFLGEAQPFYMAPYGGVAKGRACPALQEATSLADGGAWAFLYVLFEKELGLVIYLAGSPRVLTWLKRPSSSSGSRVALDRREANVGGASCLGF